MNKPREGQKIKSWVSGDPSGMSTILFVRKYTGAYPQYFKWIVRLSAKNTVAGWIETVM
mgnify:CR=1 FL=1